MKYKIFHNVNFDRVWKKTGYEVGDPLASGWSDEIDHVETVNDHLLEQLWVRHNRDERPDNRTAPSLSMGDVLIVDGNAYTICAVGFRPVVVSEHDVTGASFIDFMDQIKDEAVPFRHRQS